MSEGSTAPAVERPAGGAGTLAEALLERRPVWFDGVPHDCPVWERDRLPEGAELHGPAIIEEFGATTVVLPGWRASLDASGNVRLERDDAR